MIHLSPSKTLVMHVYHRSTLLKINQIWLDMQNELLWDVNMLPPETVNQNLLAHFWINGSDRRGSDRPTESPQSGNPNVLSFYLWVGKWKREKCSAACWSWEMEAENTPRKLFCLIKIKGNCWEYEVCLWVLKSRLLSLPLLLVRGRVRACVWARVCTASPEGCI